MAALQENVPNFVKINALTIEEMENLASKSSPHFETRTTAKLCNERSKDEKHLFNLPG